MREVLRWVGRYGKTWAIRLEPGEKGWNYVGDSFLDKNKRDFSPGKNEMHTIEPELAAFRRGGRPVYLFNKERTRPLMVKIGEIVHGVKQNAKDDGNQWNPDSEEFQEFAGKKGFLQLLRANAMGHPDLLMTVLLVAVGGAVGYIVGGYVTPHTVYVPIQTNSTVPANGAITSTVSTHT